jgi:hypothetical protein
VPVGEPGARDQRRHLLLLEHLPRDELLDVGMVDIDHDHLGGRRVVPPDLMAPAARSPILRNDIRPDDLPPPDSFSSGAADAREVRAGARAVLEEAGLADPQVHDAAFVDQVVGDALDEAGMRLRPFVGRVRRMDDAVAMIDVPMPWPGPSMP